MNNKRMLNTKKTNVDASSDLFLDVLNFPISTYYGVNATFEVGSRWILSVFQGIFIRAGLDNNKGAVFV